MPGDFTEKDSGGEERGRGAGCSKHKRASGRKPKSGVKEVCFVTKPAVSSSWSWLVLGFLSIPIDDENEEGVLGVREDGKGGKESILVSGERQTVKKSKRSQSQVQSRNFPAKLWTSSPEPRVAVDSAPLWNQTA